MGGSQCAFFEVRVFNQFAKSHQNTPLAQCYRKNEMEKRRAYDERVREIVHGNFSPLVFPQNRTLTLYTYCFPALSEKHLSSHLVSTLANLLSLFARTVASVDDIARLLNLGSADSCAPADVMTDYFGDYKAREDSEDQEESEYRQTHAFRTCIDSWLF